jgi:hypothetical protein
LYTRQGCHLCDAAWGQLQQASQAYGFALKAIDVDADSRLKELYGNEVPVLTLDGKVRFRGKINPVLLRRLLRAETDRHARHRFLLG